MAKKKNYAFSVITYCIRLVAGEGVAVPVVGQGPAVG